MIKHLYLIFLSFTFLCIITYICQQSQLLVNQVYAFNSLQAIDKNRYLTSMAFHTEKNIQIHFINSIISYEPANIKNNISTLSDSINSNFVMEEFSVPSGSRPHDVAPAPDGTIWYTAQGSGELGQLGPEYWEDSSY